jgi:beta-glucanase (GH16 family)
VTVDEGRRGFLSCALLGGAAAPLAAATAGSFVPPGYRLSFSDEFDATDTARFNETASGGRPGAPAWRSRYRHERHTVINSEKQVYVDAAYAGSASAPLGLQPFTISQSVLTISAQRLSAAQAAQLGGQRYASGCITTELTFWQRYGYFEMRARMPAGRGFWPAFWLLPKSAAWPPEIDIVEASGARPRGVHVGVIEKQRSPARPGGRWIDDVIDTTDGFHTYAAEWTAHDVAFSIDGRVQFNSGAHQMHEPMYLLANLAVGSHDASWVPDPDASTPWPGRYAIDHIRVYTRDEPR